LYRDGAGIGLTHAWPGPGGFLAALTANDVRPAAYAPDDVLTPPIKGVTPDNHLMPVNATRDDEAIGLVTGA
jgi:hypothetical protein